MQSLEELKRSYGSQAFDLAVRKLNRSRLSVHNRDPRKRFSWNVYRKRYTLQHGICPICGQVMALLKSKIEIDHKDPNRQDYNADTNLQVVHTQCNQTKGAKSIYEQSKVSNKTFVELIK